MDYRQYRLNDVSELTRLAEADPERFYTFFRKVYSVLDAIPFGNPVFIRDLVEDKDIEVFIKIVCFYIDDYRSFSSLEDSYIDFLDDYSGIFRRPGFEVPVHRHCRSAFYK